MELHNKIKDINSNISDSSSFTIKTSSKAFKILSDNLYSDKISAVIRELSCNAFDSHIQARKSDIPIEIHLPTENEKWFSVKDYGVGMSHETAMTLYTSYFHSDKNDTNELIGALGLGSKSPFAYTDIFTTEINYNGVKRLYSCFIGEDGTPNINMLDESETENCNGVEVKLSVKSDHINEFSSKAVKLFNFFNPYPVLNTSATKLECDIPIKGNDWYFNNSANVNKASAIQGCVCYPINFSRLKSNYDIDFIAGNDFFINFDIGDLDIAASREALSYDEKTISKIEEKMSHVYDEFIEIITNKINICSTVWEAKCELNRIRQKVDTRGFKNLNFKFKENFISLSQDSSRIDMIKIDDKELTIVRYDKSSHSRVNYSRENLSANHSIYLPTANDKIVFVIKSPNEERKAISKAKQIAISQSKSVYLLSKYNEKFFEALGNPGFLYSADIELEKKESGKKVKTPLKILNKAKNTFEDFNEIKEDVVKYYIPTIRGCAYRDCFKTNSISEMISNLKKLNIIKENDDVYLLPEHVTKRKKFITGKWKNLSKFVVKKLTKIIKGKEDEISYYRNSKNIYASLPRVISHLLEADNIGDMISVNSPFVKLLNLKKVVGDKNHALEILIKLASDYGISIKESSENNMNNTIDLYPMTKMISTYYLNEREIKSIIDYINIMDRVRL